MKTKQLTLTLTLALFTTFAFSQVITGSAHDFSGYTWNNDTSGEICNACHTPHSAANVNLAAPLWDRAVTTGGTYDDYSSLTFNADDANTNTAGDGPAYAGGTPTGVSLLCLTCHDGVTPLDNGGTDLVTVMASGFVKNGGTDDHPISIDYSQNLIDADGGLNAIDDPVVLTLLSASGTVECSSCHDVHNNGAGGAAGTGLYAMDNAGSLMCLACHAK